MPNEPPPPVPGTTAEEAEILAEAREWLTMVRIYEEEIRKEGPKTNHHFLLKSPSGVEFIGCKDEICSPRSPINWQLCQVVSGPMTLNEAMSWSSQHQLSTEQINQIESELMNRPAPAEEAGGYK